MDSLSIQIGNRLVGGGEPALLVAEIGINHNGDRGLARECVAAAAEAGADSVKFQNYVTEDFVSNRALTLEYESQGRQVSEPQYDLFKRCEMDRAFLEAMKACCEEYDVLFHSTPTDADGISQLVTLGAPVLKNGSDYLTHLPLIRQMGETGIPTVLSTGMANGEEIEDAVTAFRATGNQQLILLHCVSSYPTRLADVNLHRMEALRERFGSLVGFSDHVDGPDASALAAALGACWIEKHFTLDRGLPGPDHRFSADPGAFAEFVRRVREAENVMGSGELRAGDAESYGRRAFRLSCVAAGDLPTGHMLAATDVAFRRPGTGLLPKNAAQLVGRRLQRSAARGHVFELGDFE